MKRTLGYLLIVSLLLSLLPFAALAAGLRGDVNNDGIVNAKDVTVLRRWLAGGYGAAIDEKVGDVNNDGVTNAKDVTVLRRWLAGGYGVTVDPMPEDKKTYTDVVTGGQLYTDLGEPEFGEGKYTLSVLLDGEEQGDAMKAQIVSGNTDALTPVGSVTEAEIDETAKTVTISTFKYYAAQIEEVHPAEGGRQAYITLKTYDDNEIPTGEVTLADSSTVTKAFITDAFTEADVGDFVAYTKAEGLVQTLEPAEAKMGKITTGGVTATTVSLDGETYKFAASAKAPVANVGAPVGVCLDPNGNVLCSEKVQISMVDSAVTIDCCEIFRAAARADKRKGDPRTMPVEVPETIRLLVIGNSFGNDSSISYLASELKSVGAQNVTVGTLYYSGCPYKKHLYFGLNNQGVYDYYENGSTIVSNTATLDYALAAQDWTHIMLLSGWVGHPRDFGIVDSDPLLWQDLMLCYVRGRCPNAYYGYDMCWVVRDDIPRAASDEAAYTECWNADQMTMYNGIVETVQRFVETDGRFKFICPVGTSIQNARSSYLGDGGLYRDSLSHLNKGIGRYISTMTVCCTLTGVDPDAITYRPDSNLKSYLPEHLSLTKPNTLNNLEKVAKESVKNAMAKPYEITPSRYTDDADPTPGENELPIN